MAIHTGDIFAEQYTVSSSVTNIVIASTSGSMAFGDSSDDTHQFTGSLMVSASGQIGIGTTNPDGELHVHAASAGSVTAPGEGNNLILHDLNKENITLEFQA